MLEKSKKYPIQIVSIFPRNWVSDAFLKGTGITKMTGHIKRLPEGKRFGFIRGEGGLEYFFHQDDLLEIEFGNLREGDKVEFDAEPQTLKGPRAHNVKKV